MTLPRGSKDGPEDLAKRDAKGANFCSVRAHLSLTLVAFSAIDVEVTVGDGQQSQDPSAESRSTTSGEHPSAAVSTNTRVPQHHLWPAQFPSWMLSASVLRHAVMALRWQWPGGMPPALAPCCHAACPPRCNIFRGFRRRLLGNSPETCAKSSPSAISLSPPMWLGRKDAW